MLDKIGYKEKSGYLGKLQVNSKPKICFVSGKHDISTIEELVSLFGYDAKSLLNRRIVFSIEDY